MPQKPIINVHCHLFNFEFVPDRMVKRLAFIPEWLAERNWFSSVIGFICNLKFWDKGYHRIKQYIDTYRSSIEKVSENYEKESRDAGIDIYTPLMMDMEIAAKEWNVAAGDIPYHSGKVEDQITKISVLTKKNKWRMFPFIFFDPRRPGSFTICKHAIENNGFIGVKMYPALGYHPSPNIVRNLGFRGWFDKQGPSDYTRKAADDMERFYEYCAKNRVPITVHVGTGGAYFIQKHKDPENKYWRLTEATNWIDVIYPYNLKINFAHLGGDYMQKDDMERIQSIGWRTQVLDFIRLSKTGEIAAEVYADLSYHDMALRGSKMDRSSYFVDLKKVLDHEWYSERILFGTDASMISHTYTEKEYTDAFRSNLSTPQLDAIFTRNPAKFLFEKNKIPDSYIKFIAPDPAEALPDWVSIKNNEYFIF